jgi:hypothetical protein
MDDGSWELLDADGKPSQSGRFAPAEVTLELGPQKHIVGRVVDATGRPVQGARVEAVGHVMTLPGAATRDTALAHSDSDGRFALAGLDPRVPHQVLLSSAGFARAFAEAPNAVEVELSPAVLQPEAFLVGIVVDSLGRPARGIELVLSPTAEAPRTLDALDAAGWCQVRERRARTDASGRFRFDQLTLGSYELIARRGGSTLERRRVECVVDPDAQPVELALDPRWMTLCGEVRDVAGRLVPRAPVVLRTRGRALLRVSTDDTGRFHATGLDAQKTYQLECVGADGAGSTRAEFAPGESVTLFLPARLAAD